MLFAATAIAAIAVGSVVGDSAAQSRSQNYMSTGHRAPLPRQRPAAKQVEPKQTPAKAEPLTRPEFTEVEALAAQIPDLPNVRFWADSVADFQRELPPQPGPWLILSTGGEEGAFGAGLLNGWLESGSRPDFAVVTGVSTGALMATYVFAGPQFAEELHQVYTTVSATDIFEVATTPERLTDTWPLAEMINKRVTPEMLAAVAAEYKKGRRLFVLTVNLDVGRNVVWDMGAIAARGGEAALKLFRQVLLASASVEGVFPPTYITAQANGHVFQEMHADGGVKGPLYFGPEAYLMPGTPLRLPSTGLYAIVNGKLSAEFYMPSRTTAAILGRSISLALKAGGRLQLALAAIAARQANIPLNVAYVADNFEQVGRGLFDPKYMNALYDFGFAQGRGNDRFRQGMPMPARASEGATGGLAGGEAPK